MTPIIKAIRLGWRALCGADAQSRYEARHDLLSAVAARWDLRMYNRNTSWYNKREVLDVWRHYPECVPDNISDRKFILYHLALNLRSIAGDLAECGVYRAGSSFLMLAASENTGKRLYGFDSFEGLSVPTEMDRVEAERTFKWKQHDLSVDEEAARRNLERYAGAFTFYKGWIPARFDEVSDQRFSLVHIDVDLYEPTRDALSFFWPRLNTGGMIVCDDYGSDACPGAKRAMDDLGEAIGQAVIHLPSGQGLLIKR